MCVLIKFNLQRDAYHVFLKKTKYVHKKVKIGIPKSGHAKRALKANLLPKRKRMNIIQISNIRCLAILSSIAYVPPGP